MLEYRHHMVYLRHQMFTKRQIGKGIPTMGRVQIFTGDGYGKTVAALGEALMAAASGKRVVVI